MLNYMIAGVVCACAVLYIADYRQTNDMKKEALRLDIQDKKLSVKESLLKIEKSCSDQGKAGVVRLEQCHPKP